MNRERGFEGELARKAPRSLKHQAVPLEPSGCMGVRAFRSGLWRCRVHRSALVGSRVLGRLDFGDEDVRQAAHSAAGSLRRIRSSRGSLRGGEGSEE
jgi:hypothetical protein